jgi:hypothetical protein
MTKVLAGVSLVLALAACGGGTAVAYTFNKAQPSCKVHQTRTPDGPYTGAVTTVLSFSIQQAGFVQDYAHHADQAFCDRAKANADDLAWATLYTRLKAALPGAASSNLDRPDLNDPASP